MTTPHTVSYGSWKSPITTELMTASSISLGQMAIDGRDIYWLEGRPLEGGRYALMRLTPESRLWSVSRPSLTFVPAFMSTAAQRLLSSMGSFTLSISRTSTSIAVNLGGSSRC